MAPKKKKKDKSGYKQDPGRGELNKTGRDIPSNLLQVTGDTPEYYKAAEEGTFANIPNVLDEVVIVAGNDYKKQPNFNSLTKSERKLSKGKGVIASTLRQKARGEKPSQMTTASFLGGIAEGVGSLIQAPQSLAVEGIEKMRGNPSSFKNAVTPGKQRTPSQTMGLEDKPGWDVGGSLNTAMDVLADPSNLFGIGAASKIMKGAKNVPKVLKNAPKLGDDVSSSIKNFFSPGQNLEGVSDIGAKLSTPNPKNADKMGFLSNITGKNKKAVAEIEPLVRELAKEGKNYKEVISETVTNMSSPQGRQRLKDEAIAYAKLTGKKMDEKSIKEDVKQTISTIKNSGSANIDASKAIRKDGSLNRSKAMQAIYGTEQTARGGSVKLNKAGGSLINNGQAQEMTSHIGANISGKAPIKHEIGHMIKGNKYNKTGKGSPIDIELRALKQIPDESLTATQKASKGYFNKVTPYQKSERLYSGGRSMPRAALDPEPSSFAQELRQQMLTDKFISNKKGTWSDITQKDLTKASEFYKKNPRGSITTRKDGSKGGFMSSTRMFDFVDKSSFSDLAKSMNKLTGAVAPVAIGGVGIKSMFGKKKK
jgi:hypothetical protein